ncbi:MAG: hypothetical protein U0670_12945 [Anaerolineae bacterium]
MQPLDMQDHLGYQRAHQLRTRGVEPYAQSFNRSHTLPELSEIYEDVCPDEERSIELMRLCGRVMSIDTHGNTVVLRIEDQYARFQLIGSAGRLSAKNLNLLKTNVCRGDYLGFEVTTLCRVNTVLSAYIDDWCFLSLAHVPFPHPQHMSVEQQREERHLYWASSLDARERVINRSRILNQIREYLDLMGMLEVNLPSPTLEDAATASSARTDRLCQLLVGGIEQIYEIYPCNTAAPIDWLNHPQALMLDCCAAMKTPYDAMQWVEHLILRLTRFMHAIDSVDWLPLERLNATLSEEKPAYFDDQFLEIDLSAGWAWRSVSRLTHDVLGVDFASCATVDEAVNVAIQAGLSLSGFSSWQQVSDVMLAAFRQLVAPTLIQPTFVVFPAPGEEFIERFELYVNGILMGYGYAAPTDPARYSPTNSQNSVYPVLMAGMPPATHVTLYLERIMMLLLGAVDVRDLITFPEARKVMLNA